MEIVWRKRGETYPRGENLETLVSDHGEIQASMEKTWRFLVIKEGDDAAYVFLIVCRG